MFRVAKVKKQIDYFGSMGHKTSISLSSRLSHIQTTIDPIRTKV